MPIYEYDCQSCGQHFDVIQKFTDDPVTECKFCKGGVRKLMGTPALQFKGTGWYITDYAGKSPKPGGDTKEKPAASETKSEGASAPTCACASGNCGQK